MCLGEEVLTSVLNCDVFWCVCVCVYEEKEKQVNEKPSIS